MKIRLAAELQPDSIVDGSGIRTVIWTQDWSHNCLHCHNPETHNFNGGKLFDVEEVLKKISLIEGQDGVTFSGGDPMFQPKACAYLAKRIKQLGLNIWCYTGFLYEQLIESNNKDIYEFLSNIDVLIDGKFDYTKKSLDAKFRGSTNQRIIDVQSSLNQNEVITIDDEFVNDSKEKLYI